MTISEQDFRSSCQNYADFFERISPASLSELEDFCDPNIIFQDPFNRIVGIETLKVLFQDMFDQSKSVHFSIISIYPDFESRRAILKWRFISETHKIGTLDFEGLSEIRINDNGRVSEHIDYWDSGSHFYSKIPILGSLIRLIRKRLTIS
ncbi:nuclear transport factor 2 family protein [Sneathiella limimaris]|uniref:nuclear transport factor 2 family protein n=1 Tax=Sneathiella limimaris TaxID=1964213 RepID=UPI00146B3E3E